MGNWPDYDIQALGKKGTLSVAVDANGNVTGTVFGNPIQGFWDERLKTITFAAVGFLQFFTGYMTSREEVPRGEREREIIDSLAGYVAVWGPPPGYSMSGWFARPSGLTWP